MSASSHIDSTSVSMQAKTRLGRWPNSARVLAFGGTILMALGLYFAFLRPPLLPEDARYMGTTLAVVQSTTPGLFEWLRHVFWVMGGYMFATGLLTCYVAGTTFRARLRGSPIVVMFTAVTAIGFMASVNFIIASDFKWLIFSFVLPWPLALTLYLTERGRS